MAYIFDFLENRSQGIRIDQIQLFRQSLFQMKAYHNMDVPWAELMLECIVTAVSDPGMKRLAMAVV